MRSVFTDEETDGGGRCPVGAAKRGELVLFRLNSDALGGELLRSKSRLCASRKAAVNVMSLLLVVAGRSLVAPVFSTLIKSKNPHCVYSMCLTFSHSRAFVVASGVQMPAMCVEIIDSFLGFFLKMTCG